MEILTPNQIKAADAIIYDEVGAGTTSPPRIIAKSNENGWSLIESDIIEASEYLNEHGFITIIDGKGDLYYRITRLGEKYKGSGKSIADYLQKEEEKRAKILEREELDGQIKELQKQDFDYKVNKLNPAQYQSYMDFWKRHWMIVAIPLVGLLIALLTFIFK